MWLERIRVLIHAREMLLVLFLGGRREVVRGKERGFAP